MPGMKLLEITDFIKNDLHPDEDAVKKSDMIEEWRGWA
jgi:hypothetical protein